jgi:hypothetical protein
MPHSNSYAVYIVYINCDCVCYNFAAATLLLLPLLLVRLLLGRPTNGRTILKIYLNGTLCDDGVARRHVAAQQRPLLGSGS